jgi:hypothetical protein
VVYGDSELRRDQVSIEMSPVQDSIKLVTMRTFDMDDEARKTVVDLCIEAHQEDDLSEPVLVPTS